MKATIEFTFLMFFIALIVMVLFFSTAVGRGIVFGALASITTESPKFIQQDLSTYLSSAALSSGDVEIKRPLKGEYEIILTDSTVNVTSTNNVYKNPAYSENFTKGDCIVHSVDIKVSGVSNIVVRKQGNVLTIVSEVVSG